MVHFPGQNLLKNSFFQSLSKIEAPDTNFVSMETSVRILRLLIVSEFLLGNSFENQNLVFISKSQKE